MLGRYVEALALLERARRTIDGLGADAEAARLTARLADASLALSLNDEAYDLASEAAERFRSAGMTHDLADALLHCGVASVRAGRLGRAAVRLDEARTLFVQVGASARAAETALAQAEVLRSSGDAAAARSLTVAAVEQLSGGEFPAQLALALMQLADDSGGEVARRHLMRAASLVDHLGLPALAHPLHLRLGRSYRQANDLDGAREHLQAAVDVIEGLQGTVADEMLRAVFLGDKRAAIDELADLLLCLPEPDVHRAFVVCERARARTLLERATVRGAEALPSVVRPEDAADASAARELNAVYNALLSDDGRGGNERRRALHERAAVLERSATVARLKQVTEGPLDRDHASVAPALVTGDREPVPAPVLTYEVIGDSIDVFAGTGPSVRHRRLPVTATGLLATLRELEQQWSYCELGGPFVERNGEALIAGSTTVLRTLHDQLVAPVADLLPGGSGEGGGGADTVRHLTVVPSKLVHRVPFAALHDGSGHLLAQHVIATSPSAGTVPIDPSRMRPRLDRALVIGVSDATIPRAADEARAVGALLPGATVLVDDDATVARFLDLAPRAGVVHLACHGLHRADNPLFSAIRLSDGWITGHDVLRLQLGGTTVVLSACESGRHGSGGSEPVGLSWAFVAAGAQAVVVSLWAVDDGATEHLMTELYRGLIAGFGHAEALRTAQLATAAAWPHPYYWAPFVVVGPYDHGQPWRSS
jgi:tetratricopeptide (TPR) repeat protein